MVDFPEAGSPRKDDEAIILQRCNGVAIGVSRNEAAEVRSHVVEDRLGLFVCMTGDDVRQVADAVLFGGKDGGQMRLMQMGPNFEIAMYLAQATGASIVTDSAFRWREILRAARPKASEPPARLRQLAGNLADAAFLFPDNPDSIIQLAREGILLGYPAASAASSW